MSVAEKLTAPDVEENVLGTILLGRGYEHEGRLLPELFHHPQHALVVDAIRALWDEGSKANDQTVALWLRERGLLERAGGDAAVQLLATNHATGALEASLAHLEQLAARRRIFNALTASLQDLTTNPDGYDLDRLVADLTDADSIGGKVDITWLEDMVDVAEEPWVVPGLLRRKDRLMLTGFEGLGKSMLLRQFAVAAARGVHPFTREPVDPVRVAYVDLENPPYLIRKMLRRIDEQTVRFAAQETKRSLAVLGEPGGIDLTRPAEVGRLLRWVAQVKPQLLVIGPIYKLVLRDPHTEESAMAIARTLDRMRVRHDMALIMEHHSPHADGPAHRTVRPIGSSLWLRWPEFGIGMLPTDPTDPRVMTMLHWRGARDERAFPKQVRRGEILPWHPVGPA